jgi:cbb3-type cytochrome c oxidase subunit III
MKTFVWRVGVAITIFTLMSMVSACSGLAGEVAIVATLTPVSTSPVASVANDSPYIDAPANLINGAQIYAENCTACHGTGGAGDGTLVQNGQVGAMPSFLDVEHLRSKRPDQYYDIITNGNLEKLMPPWADALSTQERWDVALYVYTLHYSPATLALGEQLYATHCAECHGITGVGDGEKQRLIGGEAYDLTYHNDMNYIGDADVVELIRYGKGEAMPALDGKVSQDDMWAIAAYIRSFSTSRQQPAQPLATEEVNAETTNAPLVEGNITITGSVTNGTAGASVPPNMTVYLRYGSSADDIQDTSAIVQTDGSFRFENIPLVTDYGYVVNTIYQNTAFVSDVKQAEELQQDNTMPLVIYELTDDPFVISVKDVYTQIEKFPEIENNTLGQGLLVTQRLTYFNNSDRVFQLTQNNRTFSVLIQVPAGAVILDARQNPRFLVAQDSFAIIDQYPMYPNDNLIDINYFLPYDDGAIFDQPFNYPINGTVQVVLGSKSLRLLDTGWTLDDTAPFINQYTRTYTESNKGSLKFELRGKVDALTNDNPAFITANILIPVIAVVVIVVCVCILFISQWQRRRNPDVEVQLLLRQLAELDTLHDKGQINHDAYQRQRQSLKTRLTTLMASQSSKDAKP